MIKNTLFSYKIRVQIKVITATVIIRTKIFSVPEGNICIAKPNLGVLPLT